MIKDALNRLLDYAKTARVRARIKKLGWEVSFLKFIHTDSYEHCQTCGTFIYCVSFKREELSSDGSYWMTWKEGVWTCLRCGEPHGSHRPKNLPSNFFDLLNEREVEAFAKSREEHAQLRPDEVTARLQRIRASQAQETALLKQATALREQRLREEALLPKEGYRTEVKQLKE